MSGKGQKKAGGKGKKQPDVGWSQKLRFYHEQSGLSLRGLSQQSGVSQKVIKGIEEGSIMHPDIHDLYKLTLAFGITFDDLLYPLPFNLIEKQTEHGVEWGVCPSGWPNDPEYFPVGKKEDAIALLNWINRNIATPCKWKPGEYDESFREKSD